jgi:hypothetical protein
MKPEPHPLSRPGTAVELTRRNGVVETGIVLITEKGRRGDFVVIQVRSRPKCYHRCRASELRRPADGHH